MKNKKILWLVLALAVIIVGSVVYSKGNAVSQTVKIGALYPMTGGLASYGEPARNAAQIAVDDVNAAGGVNGTKLELIVADHQCDPKEAVSVFEKLSSIDNIHVFTSAACTGTVLSIVPSLETKQAVLLGTVTSGNKLTGVSSDFFRNWASDAKESSLLAKEALRAGYKNVAVIYEDTDYAKGLAVAMQQSLSSKGVKVAMESFASGATDVRTQLTKLASLKPDLVFVSVQTVPSGEMALTQMEQLKFQPNQLFVNDNILKSTVLIKNHPKLLNGAIGGDYTFAMTDKLQAFLAKYKVRYGTDCPQVNICAAEYDAIQLLAKAIAAKGDSASSVSAYLKTAQYSGLSGQISFDTKNDRSNAEYSLFQIRQGELVGI